MTRSLSRLVQTTFGRGTTSHPKSGPPSLLKRKGRHPPPPRPGRRLPVADLLCEDPARQAGNGTNRRRARTRPVCQAQHLIGQPVVRHGPRQQDRPARPPGMLYGGRNGESECPRCESPLTRSKRPEGATIRAKWLSACRTAPNAVASPAKTCGPCELPGPQEGAMNRAKP